MTKWYAVYPDSSKLDLADENECVAIFKYRDHAIKYGLGKWDDFFEIKEVEDDFESIMQSHQSLIRRLRDKQKKLFTLIANNPVALTTLKQFAPEVRAEIVNQLEEISEEEEQALRDTEEKDSPELYCDCGNRYIHRQEIFQDQCDACMYHSDR